jgi:hypothetical protein
MLTTHAPRTRRLAAAGAVACLASLATACGSSGSSIASRPAQASSAGAGAQTASKTFLAPSQDLNGSPLHEPACTGYGCPLSGDGTAVLYKITWTTWSATEAVGTGTYRLDGCNPSCAAGPIYPVATVVTLSQPVKVCTSSGTHWVFSRASFTFPHGLPKVLQGQNGPTNPWTFTPLITAAQQSCP